ncbi:Mannose-1-phosphate guanylyltransferase [Thalictrum thalictroides]|uniref:Mannose-1-phosphate guanylyltransferase n=1 Tax=Thalictrum thalictroides TaxID=46969 RepID=A0A7J6UZK0_THATH|nr:Mannose-1-phosphate guanylyltransferase [Thalictrum thalictroides]
MMGHSSSSSSEEEKLVQMVQDFIESRSPSPISLNPSKVHLSLDHHPTYLSLQGILGSVTKAEMVVLKRVLKHLKNVKFERSSASLKKWLVMKLKKDGFVASLCRSKNSWNTTSDCSGCDYEYIDIIMEDQNGGSIRLIVDLDFNSQFELARPTPTYSHLLKALPTIFVGSEDKLLKIVSILCSAAKQSLKERGLHIPPWRKTSYMQSKWISSDSEKASSTTDKENSSKGGGDNSTSLITEWSPPKIKPKGRDLGGGGGGSALTIEFSNMSINCC